MRPSETILASAFVMLHKHDDSSLISRLKQTGYQNWREPNTLGL